MLLTWLYPSFVEKYGILVLPVTLWWEGFTFFEVTFSLGNCLRHCWKRRTNLYCIVFNLMHHESFSTCQSLVHNRKLWIMKQVCSVSRRNVYYGFRLGRHLFIFVYIIFLDVSAPPPPHTHTHTRARTLKSFPLGPHVVLFGAQKVRVKSLWYGTGYKEKRILDFWDKSTWSPAGITGHCFVLFPRSVTQL
jgi:hypothetical protein